MKGFEVGLEFEVRVLNEADKRGGESVRLLGDVSHAKEFHFSPAYAVTRRKGEVVVSVMAGRSVGQRRFDCLSLGESFWMERYALLQTIKDVVAFEQARIVNQERADRE